MDLVTQKCIFEPFFTTKPTGSGTGLGLTIVREAVEAASGRILVSSRPGQGTSFKIYFPHAAAEAASAAAEKIEVLPGSSPRGSETVLLVEDDNNVRLVLGECLRRHGYEVLEAANGEEAVQIHAILDGGP